MSMTKKDYELIASVIRLNYGLFASNIKHAEFAGMMAAELYYTNPLFDRAKFIMACMPRHLIGSAKGHVPWEKAAGLR